MKKRTENPGILVALTMSMMLTIFLSACGSDQAATPISEEEITEVVSDLEETTEPAEGESTEVTEPEESAEIESTEETAPETESEQVVYEGIDMESTLPGAEWIATFNGIITEPKFVIFNDDTNKKVIVENGQEVEFDDTDVFAIFFPLEKEIVRAELDDNLTFKFNSVKKNVRYYDNISARIKDGDKVEIKQRLEVDGEEETLTVTLVIKRN
jgi:lipoprotein